ncbi:MAG: peptidoglycan-binding protein [Eubacteriales bacterium]|nr:peptidoglycan-binding protein [Eubacteriales bacterium]
MKRIIALILSVSLLLAALPALGETISATPTTTAGTDSTAFTGTPEELLQQWYQLGALLRENGLYPFVDLKKGDTGYEVTALQTRLKELGYYQKEVTDNYGNGTYTAMRAFEKANGAPVNGEASVTDQQALFKSDAVKYSGGSTSSGNTTTNSASSGSGADATSGATK